MGSRYPNANAGEAPGPNPDDDVAGAAPIEQRLYDRHQPLGMAAADQFVMLPEALAVGVEQGGAAGCS
jgi:hypothetical protein